MGRFGSPERRLPPVLALLRGPGQQSRRHGATQTRAWSAILKTRRHPRDTPSSSQHGPAPHPRHAQQQSPWHSATHATHQQQSPWHSATQATHRQQSPTHGATHATRRAAIPMAQRRTRDPPSSNPHGTAAPTRPAQQQSPWHSGTHGTRATRPKHRSARRRDATRDDARRPSGHTANEANTGPAPRPPDYKREPFATHSGRKNTS